MRLLRGTWDEPKAYSEELSVLFLFSRRCLSFLHNLGLPKAAERAPAGSYNIFRVVRLGVVGSHFRSKTTHSVASYAQFNFFSSSKVKQEGRAFEAAIAGGLLSVVGKGNSGIERLLTVYAARK